VTTLKRSIRVLAVCLGISLAAAGEEVRLVPVFRAGAMYEISNLFAHDLDGDGNREIVACSSGAAMALAARNGTYEPMWHAPAAGCNGGVAAGDLDGDGGAEVVTAYTQKIMIFDPRGLAGPRETLTIPGGPSIADVAIGNVDDDSAPEIVAVTSGATYVYDGLTHELQWTATGYGGNSVRIGDVDGDARREIVASGSTAYVLDGAAETQKWGYVGGFGSAWTLGNVDADAKDEIVFAEGTGVTILNGDTFSTTSWEAEVSGLAVADADDDGTNEIITGSYYEHIIGRNPATGATLWSINNAYYGFTMVDAADLDGDGVPEVFWTNGTTFAAGEAAVFQPDFRSVSYYGRHFSAFGDLDGDGRLEYVIASGSTGSNYGAIRIFDSETDVVLGTLTMPLYSYVNGLAIGQLDNDAALEIAAPVGYSNSNSLFVWDGVTMEQEFTTNNGGNGSTFGSAVKIANIDADAVDEIIATTNDQHVVVLNGATNIIQKSLATSGSPYTLALADLNGDSVRELTVGTSSGVTVYDTTSWAVLGSASVPYIQDLEATAAGGGTVALVTTYIGNDLRVFKGATLTPAYTCTENLPRLTFADIGGDVRLLAGDQTGALRVYPLDGASCPEDVESVFVTRFITDLTTLDVTGDGRDDLIVDSNGATAVALLGLSSEVRGDVDGDEVITSDDIDDAVDYLFGVDPGISPSADASADERISVEDLFVLIDHEFAGGAAPQP
jgi:hypothetical protein